MMTCARIRPRNQSDQETPFRQRHSRPAPFLHKALLAYRLTQLHTSAIERAETILHESQVEGHNAIVLFTETCAV